MSRELVYDSAAWTGRDHVYAFVVEVPELAEMSQRDERLMGEYLLAAGGDYRTVNAAIKAGYAKWPRVGPRPEWIKAECERMAQESEK